MRASLMRWTSLVLIPGMIFVFGVIYLVSPTHTPTPQSWANGTYLNACCAPLVLRDGNLTAAGGTTHYVVSESKFGNQIDVATGIGVRHGQVVFGGTFAYVRFNHDSMARPATGGARSLHLTGLDDHRDYVFVRQD